MSNTKTVMAGALGATITAALLYFFLPKRIEIQREIERIQYAVPALPALPEVVRVRYIPYESVGYLKTRIPPKTKSPLRMESRYISGLAVYFPTKTFYEESLVEQIVDYPIEVCSSTECGVSLTPGSAIMLSIDDLSKVYIKNNNTIDVVVEAVYYER